MSTINGIHHITAIAGNAQRNYDFYTKTLGLRLVKKTVNFDDPHTYHFYYGDYNGTPGTILTFFPWEGIVAGRRGTGQATEIGYSVPAGSLEFWRKRFEARGVLFNNPSTKFGEEYLTFLDPDGLKFEMFATSPELDSRKQYTTAEVTDAVATKGFHNITITLDDIKGTADVLKLLGYELKTQEVNRYRFALANNAQPSYIDLVEVPGEKRGHVAGGSVHHIAFRVPDDATQMAYRSIIEDKGFNITPQIDRNYFNSLYFREPGGVLFEIATDQPGFAVDEPAESLGTSLKLPAQYESNRAEIENHLPKIIQ